ncbi:MAG: hypothetical protein K2H85_03505, partial [Allobaculum sp.]|nr:hypothetical protein [Allobaculum sp.]
MNRSGFIANCPYPDSFLEGRREIEQCVIGCLFQDPLLFDDTKILSGSNFLDMRCRNLYELCAKLRAKGFSTFDSKNVYSILDAKNLSRFEKMGGMELFRKYATGISLINWETYLDDLVRENTFCHLYDMNIDCSKPQEWQGKEIIPLEVFREQRNEDLLAFWDGKLAEIPTATSSKVVEKGEVTFDEEWIASLQEGIENGDPFEYAFQRDDGSITECYPMLSKNISGLLPGTTTMLGAYSSVGKSTWWVGVLMALLASGKKVLVISNEEPMSKIKQKIFIWISKNIFGYSMTKKQLVSGDLTQEDRVVMKDVLNF